MSEHLIAANEAVAAPIRFRSAPAATLRRTLGFRRAQVGLAILLFVIAMLIIYTFGQQETELERILRSSRTAAILTAFVAAATAPLVEEIIYRGILYSALQRVTGAIAAVGMVTVLFAALHVLQYWPNFGAIPNPDASRLSPPMKCTGARPSTASRTSSTIWPWLFS